MINLLQTASVPESTFTWLEYFDPGLIVAVLSPALTNVFTFFRQTDSCLLPQTKSLLPVVRTGQI